MIRFGLQHLPGRYRIPCSFLFILFMSVAVSGVWARGQNKFAYSEKDARKVLSIIDNLIKERMRPNPKLPEKIRITENELNSYIIHRIISEEEEIMKELQLKIFGENKIEGKVYIDLRGQNLPSFLRPEMYVLFSGTLVVEDDKVRLDLKDLFLGNQRVQPLILDTILAISASVQNTEVTGLSDWYELPYGIKNISTEKGTVYFYFR